MYKTHRIGSILELFVSHPPGKETDKSTLRIVGSTVPEDGDESFEVSIELTTPQVVQIITQFFWPNCAKWKWFNKMLTTMLRKRLALCSENHGKDFPPEYVRKCTNTGITWKRALNSLRYEAYLDHGK